MSKIIINENSDVPLEKKYISIAEEILRDNEDLPIKINNNTLSFKDYTVGVLRLDDLLIEIKSRNNAITMKSIFEMYSFVSSEYNEFQMETTGYDIDSTFELSSISSYFYKICYALLSQGLTGVFKKVEKYSDIVKGSIVFESYNKYEVPYKGVNIIDENYTLNSLQNQIIKAALKKLIEYEQKEEVIIKLNTLLREFDYVDDREFTYQELDEIKLRLDSFYSANDYYPIVLDSSVKILMDLKASYSNGSVEWYSFLVNSNDIFEKYVRKLLDKGLNESVTKWNEPKVFTSIKGNDQYGIKSYTPDILIDYDEYKDISRAVIDVKNKEFNPSTGNVADLVSSNDLYQILFYCRQLKSNIGIIIYPVNNNYEPYVIEINDEGNPQIFLLSINMKDKFENRYIKLVKEVKDQILINT
ncbi:5-methylcytosine-specific restriction endonuclease McrBC regulatory subunit McrC [Alkalibacillus flavidus]|uniref:5-methylcytosine-specific restriction endonuclease McrBC regulatory subunit McrC n=1 Tax=Alkalibacillus flavidus TaxID=546021 RepID=A0ABV2L0I6_9BACI